MKIKLSYADICGNNNGALNGCKKQTNKSNNEDLEAYNRFFMLMFMYEPLLITGSYINQNKSVFVFLADTIAYCLSTPKIQRKLLFWLMFIFVHVHSVHFTTAPDNIF